MKEIGQKLKDKREENGVSVEEAAEDLKMRPSQITNLEEGNKESFKDSLFLKYFIRDYAKYLGLDSEKILDEYNEYMFDVTSKISLDDIEEAKKNKKEDENKISSPYTIVTSDKKIPKYVFYIVGVIALLIIGYIVVSSVGGNDFDSDNITYAIRR